MMHFLLAASAALSARPFSALVPGEALDGVVVTHHKDKLFLRVDVERDTGKLAGSTVNALLKLPAKHALLQQPRMGAPLTVYVRGTGGGHLRVGLSPPRPAPRSPPPDSESFLKLEELKPGDELTGFVATRATCGIFVDAGVWRRGPGGSWRPTDGLLPVDQQGAMSMPKPGDAVTVRVLEPVLASGNLLLTAREGPIEELVDELHARRRLAKARQRRKSSVNLAAGSQREGQVVRVESYGLLVNIGAKQPGLVHISNLGPGFVDEVGGVASVGDVVLVKVLAPAKLGQKGYRREDKLRLKLVRKLVKKGETVPAALMATARRGEKLSQRFERLEDARDVKAARQEADTAAEPEPDPAAALTAAARRKEAERSVATQDMAMVEDRLAALTQELEEEEEEEEEDRDDDYYADKYEDQFY